MESKKKVMLVVLDGWGIRKSKKDNAVKLARKVFFDRLWKENPHTTLFAAEQHVGLPGGFIGNSEVGHTNLGAGRLIPQELLKINQSIENRSFFKNRILLEAMDSARKNSSALHLMGLVSDGGVHSHISHLFALLRMAKENNVKQVYIHCFLDGRDKPPKSALKYIRLLEKECRNLKTGSIATIIGRFYAMDRDNRWNREHKAYDSMVNGKGILCSSAEEAIKAAYKRGETDEFVKPSIIAPKTENAKSYVKENDSIIFFNFREDRARELTRAFVEGRFRKFNRKKIINLNFVCLTQYDASIKVPAAFPPSVPKETLGEVISRNKLKQLRIAETEKYAHVTYFFNCGKDGPFPGEDRVMIPSPRVSTYDKTPAMSASKIAAEAVNRLNSGKYSFIVLNFANSDMVGHTGQLDVTVKAIEAVDKCLSLVVKAARKNGYDVIVVADHGNAEEMSGPHQTSHTTNKVPFILVSSTKYKIAERKNNSIANMGATVLKIMGIAIPRSYSPPLIRQ